jgi:hypothetical protein
MAKEALMQTDIAKMLNAATLLYLKGPGNAPAAEQLIVQAGHEALQRGGLEAMSTLLDECRTYARETLHCMRDDWRMIAVVWEARVPTWRDA